MAYTNSLATFGKVQETDLGKSMVDALEDDPL